MPTFNGEKYLSSALNSLKLQADDTVELIAVDAGSVDATIHHLNKYGEDRRLTLIQRTEQGNWVSSTNRGLSVARGDFVCFLHQDDVWHPERLCWLRNLTIKYPYVSLFVHPARFIGPKGNDLGQWRCPLSKNQTPLPSQHVIERLLIQNFLAIPSPLIRRRDIIELGGLDETLWYTADWDLWLKLASRGATMCHPACLADFRVHAESQTHQRASTAKDFQWQMETVLDRHLTLVLCHSTRQQIERIAHFSISMNVWLASKGRNSISPFISLLLKATKISPAEFTRYLCVSCVLERVSARLRLRLFNN